MDGARQQFQEQIDFFRKKLNLATERWDDIEWGAMTGRLSSPGRKRLICGATSAAVDQSVAGQSIGEFRRAACRCRGQERLTD
ncbi:MAG: hypothetical protein IPN53_22950 [Comamonadaceae bacterium]|nr:hypothetical protein [Comamonadaceae bacterium]